MRIACILPAHNEEAVLERAVRKVLEWGKERFHPQEFVVVVSENGSVDRTRAIADGLSQEFPELEVIYSDAPGKGGAIRRGMQAVDADAYLAMDVDLSTDLASAGGLIDLIVEGTDLAVASRRMPDSRVRRPALRRAVTTAYSYLADAALGLGVRDLQCGCKAYSRRVRDYVLPSVNDEGFFFDTELLARSRRAGFNLIEVGVRWEEPPEFQRKSSVKLFVTSLDFLRKLAELRAELR